MHLIELHSSRIKQTFIVLSALFIMISTSACKSKKDEYILPIDTSMALINASNPYIQYMGRFDFRDSLAPRFSHAGVSIKAKFSGTTIDILLQDYSHEEDQSTNYFSIFIDDKLYKVIAVNSDQINYPISRNLSDTKHTIEIFKRTEAVVGESIFLGFQLSKNKNLSPLKNKDSRKIEFIGDSFTCGYGNEVSIPASPEGNPLTGFHSINENNYTAWGALTCRNLEAQYHCTAFSGKGVYRNIDGSTYETIPDMYNRVNPTNPFPIWNTNNYIPDVIVIHLGTNDFGLERTTTPDMVDSSAFVNSYISFVERLRIYYPSAKIICVVPNSLTNEYPAGFKSLDRIKNYIQIVYNSFKSKDNKIYYFELEPQQSPYGEDFHPSAETHKSMAIAIESYIKSITGW